MTQNVADKLALRLSPSTSRRGFLRKFALVATALLSLAIGIGEGAEMLRPLAVTIVAGLSFSMLVSLVLVPVMYELTHLREWRARVSADRA